MVYGNDSLSDYAMVPRVGWIPANGQPYGGLPVTLRVRQVVQPRGGWLPVGCLARRPLGDPMTLRPRENRSPAAVGLAVDYLTRLMCGDDPRDAFQVSVAGAVEVGMDGDALTLLERIHGLDDASVRSALDLVRYDQTVRRGSPAPPPAPFSQADEDACWNVRRMVQRSCRFLEAAGPVTWPGFTFDGGYTDVVSYGDGDFLTEYVLWDMKTTRRGPSTGQTLQVLCATG